jgi:hypothetical protein
MGQNSKDRIADSLDTIADALANILTEQRAQRVTLAKISARLAIETDDRIEGDEQLGRVQVEHARRLSLVGHGGE